MRAATSTTALFYSETDLMEGEMIRSVDDLSSGYSSTEFLTRRQKKEARTSSLSRTASTRSSRSGAAVRKPSEVSICLCSMVWVSVYYPVKSGQVGQVYGIERSLQLHSSPGSFGHG